MFNNFNIGLDNLWKSSVCFSTDTLWGWVKPRGKIWCRLLVNMSWKLKPWFYAVGLPFQTLYLLFSQWLISNKLLWTHKIAISMSSKYPYVGLLMSIYTSKRRKWGDVRLQNWSLMMIKTRGISVMMLLKGVSCRMLWVISELSVKQNVNGPQAVGWHLIHTCYVHWLHIHGDRGEMLIDRLSVLINQLTWCLTWWLDAYELV